MEPFNRAMFSFNDKLYFWVLKPVAQGYNKVVPEAGTGKREQFFLQSQIPDPFRQLPAPGRFQRCGHGTRPFHGKHRLGSGGLLDPASSKQLNIPKKEADLGQTLGVYGVGQGFYIVWPILGPSSARDSIEIVGDYFLYPVNYITPWYDWLAVRAYEMVNDTSLRIGDYESLKEAAIDPYVALRDAYAQYRQKMVEAAKGKQRRPNQGE